VYGEFYVYFWLDAIRMEKFLVVPQNILEQQ